METGIIYPELGDLVAQDARRDLRDHAETLEASARDDEDLRRSREVRQQAAALDERLHTPFG